MPARLKPASLNTKPQGSMMSTPTPKQAQVRIKEAAFCGMSGSKRAKRKISPLLHTQQLRTAGLHPVPFGSVTGFRFDLTFTTKDGLQMKGIALFAQRRNNWTFF